MRNLSNELLIIGGMMTLWFSIVLGQVAAFNTFTRMSNCMLCKEN
jgi:hypothetical protein